MKVLATIEKCPIFLLDDGTVTFTARARIDVDGSGSSHGDPYYQNETSLKQSGKSLNADADRYIAVPPQIIQGVKAIILGCQAFVTNTRNGTSSEAVVGDEGPRKRLGEISYALAVALGINPDPVNGGIDDPVIHYSIHPGNPALVEGKQYTLQPS